MFLLQMYNSQCYDQELPTQASPELSTTSTIPNSLDSSLSNMSVVIEEELILEGTDEEHLIVKVLHNILLILLY